MTVKKIFCIFWLFYISFLSFADENIKVTGTYIYLSEVPEHNWFLREEITLNADSTFYYKYYRPFIKQLLQGYWTIKDSNLILNSFPKNVMIKIKEEYNLNDSTNKTFYVTNLNGSSANYDLQIVNEDNDTIKLNNQLFSSKYNGNIIFFYITTFSPVGIKYPDYYLKCSDSNRFYININEERIFDNEVWKIVDNEIVPKDAMGEWKNYRLNHFAKF